MKRHLAAGICVVAVNALAFVPSAQADITRIVITRVESPTFEGVAFGSTGPYEKIVGRAFGEVDPNDPRNRAIVDLAFAPRNARGNVEYATDLYLLAPVDRARGNHRIFFEINNRGNNLSFGVMNDATPGGNDPTTAADAGNGFLMRQGYTIVLSGWDISVPAGSGRLTMTVPIARNRDGSSITGPSLEEFVIDNATTLVGPLSYPAATLDKRHGTLTTRIHYADVPTEIPATGWEYVNERTIRLLPPGTPFLKGHLYEFSYVAKEPLVAGLAFAALRDLAMFLRDAAADDDGTANPLAGSVERIYTFGVSQPARFIRDFNRLGFNESSPGRRVFDANLNWIGGASGGFFNYRFAQPARTHRQHIARWYPERQFPFANPVTFDPVTGKTDGVLRECLATRTCPTIFEVNSGNEYWSKAGSLLHTDTMGNDLHLADARSRRDLGERDDDDDRDARDAVPNVRYYLLASLPHVAATGVGICQQERNPLVANVTLRALMVALDQWVTLGTQPPRNAVPRRANGTLVPSLPQEGMGFPLIPGVTYNGRLHEGDLLDFGPTMSDGILTTIPAVLVGSPYPVFVPRTDEDGNDTAGIRMVEIEVPLATYTGWGVRAGPAAEDGCDAFGQKIDFPRTAAERVASGDPRRSLEERYPSHDDYVSQVRRAARRLQKKGLLLEDDVRRYIHAAMVSDIGQE
jgi:alpha/beta hydrolase family protein